ncbi:PREDICTED: formin-like protein 20 [Rhagoletis zephyria]|uniref:formin-like protein 20 n=1 Tax=Rhagoletis zephyria TaxID=28612 RepID=UPI0008113CAE|nr:PREDICTED: formin-like protein 20 [Rhagoletis zephyria]
MPPKQQQQQRSSKDCNEKVNMPAAPEPSAPPMTLALQPLLSPPPQYKSTLSLANYFEKDDQLPSSSKHQQPAPSPAHHRQASPMQKSKQFLAQGGTLTTSSQPKLSPPTSAEKLALLSKYFSGSRPPPTPPELLSPATTEQKSVIMAKYFASGRPPPPPPNQSLPPFFLQSPPPPLPPPPQLTAELMNKFFPIQYYSTNQCPLCMQEVAEILKKSKY